MLRIISCKYFHLILKETLTANSDSSTTCISAECFILILFTCLIIVYSNLWQQLCNQLSMLLYTLRKTSFYKTMLNQVHSMCQRELYLRFPEMQSRKELRWEGKRCTNLHLEKDEAALRSATESRKWQVREGEEAEGQQRVSSSNSLDEQNWELESHWETPIENLHNRTGFD